MEFEWDANKEWENFRAHGVHFETAERVFFDPLRMERHDDENSGEEDRWQTLGLFEDVLFVVYTERGDVTRIISARLAEPFERRIYHAHRETRGWKRVIP